MGRIMHKPQVVKAPNGEKMVLLAKADYDALVERAGSEDAGITRIVDRTDAALARGEEVVIPAASAERVARGENTIKVVREWRGMTQMKLADRSRIGQSYIAALEKGTRKGTTKTLRAIATALQVPLSLLVPD